MITVLLIILGLIAINLLLLRYSVQSVEQKQKKKASKAVNTSEKSNTISDAA